VVHFDPSPGQVGRPKVAYMSVTSEKVPFWATDACYEVTYVWLFGSFLLVVGEALSYGFLVCVLHRVQKRRHQTHGGNFVNSQPIFNFFTARKATHGLDGQHQDVDRTLRGRVNQNDRGHG